MNILKRITTYYTRSIRKYQEDTNNREEEELGIGALVEEDALRLFNIKNPRGKYTK